jgi:hypothetical protein
MDDSKSEVITDAVVKLEDGDVAKNDPEEMTTNDAPETGGGETSKGIPDQEVTDKEMKEEGKDAAKMEVVEPPAEEPPLKKKRKPKALDPAMQEVASKRERRERKSVEAFDPNAFPVGHAPRSVVLVVGRGARLGDLAPCVEAMEANAPQLPVAYRLVFKPKAAAKKKEMMQNLLEFNGYLPQKDVSLNEEEQEARDDELEVRAAFGIPNCFSPLRYIPSSRSFV